MKDIFFDIDGVLTIETEGYSEGEYANRTPNERTIAMVNMFYHQNYKITLYTARHSEDREITEYWLKKYEVKYHDLIFDKPHYDLLIDDKVMEFTEASLLIIDRIGRL